MKIKCFLLFTSIYTVTYGFQKDGMTNRSERQDHTPSMNTDTGTTGHLWSGVTQSSTTREYQTMVTVKHQDQVCHEKATGFAYRYDLCAGAGDPESYLGLAKPRYTCVGRCGEPSRYVNQFFHCGCDASCEAFKDCCRDMAQVCPDLHNTENAEYAQFLKGFTGCNHLVILFNEIELPFSFSTKPYPFFTAAVISKRTVLPFKSRTLSEFTWPLRRYHVVDTKRKFVFVNYNAYNAYKTNHSTPYFVPMIASLTCDFPESKSSRFHSVLDMLPWCRVSQVKHSTTEYHRPCKSHQILVCRCEDGQFLREHVHNACLGRNYSQQSRYRIPLWDRQLDYVTDEHSRKEICVKIDRTALGGYRTVKDDRAPLDTTLTMRILPVLSRSRGPPNTPYKVEVEEDEGVDRELAIGAIVELTNSAERRFYCPSMRSRLEDCWLEKCTEGGLLLSEDLSHGLPARRSCIVPVAAKVFHGDRPSGFRACTCFGVLAALHKLGLWRIRIQANKETGCLFHFTALLKGEFIVCFVLLFEKIPGKRSAICRARIVCRYLQQYETYQLKYVYVLTCLKIFCHSKLL